MKRGGRGWLFCPYLSLLLEIKYKSGIKKININELMFSYMIYINRLNFQELYFSLIIL
jgi:hypothetical protein